VIDPAGAVETFLTPPRIRDRPAHARILRDPGGVASAVRFVAG